MNDGGAALRNSGTVFGCLGHDQSLDVLPVGKPKGHDFRIAVPRPAVARHMSVTSG